MPIRRRKDIGHKEADKELERIQKKLEEEYKKAYAELKKKADKYFEQYNKQVKEWMDAVKAGERSDEDFLAWKKREMLNNKRYDVLVRNLSKEMTKTDQMARDIVNGHLADIYAENYNFTAFEICKDAGINLQFDLVDRRTVERLVADDKIPLPQASLDTIKAFRWNEKNIKSALFQGIVQGDSMDDIAKRLRSVTDMDEAASIRNARTMTTAAECAGRQSRMEEAAEEYGIEMKKTWIATLDDRTRDAHAELDGESVDIDEPFVNSIGKIMFPCDPDCPDGENVYNCRCTMITSVKKYPKDLSRREMGKGIEDMSYDEWKREAKERAEEAARKKREKE